MHSIKGHFRAIVIALLALATLYMAFALFAFGQIGQKKSLAESVWDDYAPGGCRQNEADARPLGYRHLRIPESHVVGDAADGVWLYEKSKKACVARTFLASSNLVDKNGMRWTTQLANCEESGDRCTSTMLWVVKDSKRKAVRPVIASICTPELYERDCPGVAADGSWKVPNKTK